MYHNTFYSINYGQIVAKTTIPKIEPYFNPPVKLSIANQESKSLS